MPEPKSNFNMTSLMIYSGKRFPLIAFVWLTMFHCVCLGMEVDDTEVTTRVDDLTEVTSRANVTLGTTVHPNTTTTSTTPTTTTTTTTTPIATSILTITSSSPNSTTSNNSLSTTMPSSTLATVRLYSNILNVKPETPIRHKQSRTEPNVVNEAEAEDPENSIWKMVMHGTNMNSEELRMCNKSLIQIHFKPHSRRKIARTLKKELDKTFSKWNYRFSVVLSTTSRNTMGKSLHGVWLSISINGVHYFITATHNVIDGPKLKEEQMDKLEYWSELHAIAAHNMTGYRKYNKIASKLKTDLDRQYGYGNVWSVIIVKNRYLVKAKVFEDPTYHLEFTRLNGGNFIVFRGGENIDVTSRNSRELAAAIDDESSEHTNDYGNIYS